MILLTSPQASGKPMHERPSTHPIVLLSLGLLMGLGLLCYHVFPLLDPPNVSWHILASFGLFGLYIAAVWCARDLHGGGWLWLLLGLGLLFHLLMLPLSPSMSDDMFRYLWDGRMQSFGMNPFAYPPTSAQLAPYHELSWFPFINHPNYRTVYPPTAQFLFWLGQGITPGSFLGHKLLLLLFQVGLVGLLAVWLRRRSLPMGRLLWVAWCPLPLFEVMLDGHLDGFAPALLVAVLLAAQSRRAWLCGVCLGLALLVKPLPLFVVPLLLWHLRWRKALQMSLACALTCLLLYLPFLDAGAFLFQSLLAYSKHWSFNGPIYELFSIWFVPGAVRKILAGCIILVSLAIPFVRLPLTLEQRFLVPLATYMLLTPTLYPWYVVWLLPFLVLAPGPWLFWLVGTVLSTHYVHQTYLASGWWRLEPTIVLFEFVPLFLLLCTQFWLYLRHHRHRWSWRSPWARSRALEAELATMSARIAALEAAACVGESEGPVSVEGASS